ncbi:MAG: hypothetical protein HOP33_22625 [Verrucomicrobia bacterium]|jgi:hypothetical protein|nr:hypothetical protein [Verrucomicrobiota bacterium]
MFRQSANQEKQRFYLLPGMGGRNYRRKQKVILKASLIVGVLVSAVFAAVMYFVSRSPH